MEARELGQEGMLAGSLLAPWPGMEMGLLTFYDCVHQCKDW